MDISGRKILVTGSGTGIGRGVAIRLAELGADLALHYSTSTDGVRSVAEVIRELGRATVILEADLRDPTQAEGLAKRAADGLGGIDGLVNNSGVTMNRSIAATTIEQYDALFNVNMRGMFFTTKGAVEVMPNHSPSSIVNISSVHAFGGLVEHSVYAATKAAITGFTRTGSVELIQNGIRMNCIAPGWIEVESHAKTFGRDETFDLAAAGQVLPSGFVGEGADVGNLSAFLLSPASRFIVGQTIVCDGGQTALLPATGDFRDPTRVQHGRGYVPGL